MTQYPDIRFRKDNRPESKYDWYEVMEDCIVITTGIIIPKGYITDFSSVPRVLWPFIPPYGKAVDASILHDFLYTSKTYSAYFGEHASRAYADAIFYSKMLEAGVPKWQARMMYLAVRWFGKGHYGNEDRTSRVA